MLLLNSSKERSMTDPRWTSGYVTAASSPCSVSYPSLTAAVLILDETEILIACLNFQFFVQRLLSSPCHMDWATGFHLPLCICKEKKKIPRASLDRCPCSEQKFFLLLPLAFSLGWVLREILDMFPKTNVWKQRRMLTILKMIGLDNAPYYFSLKKRRKGNVCPIISCMTHHSLHQFSSVAQLCLILCDPMDYSVPGFPVHHQFFIHIL